MISHQCITVGSCVSSGAIRTESQLISNVIPVSAYAAASKIASPYIRLHPVELRCPCTLGPTYLFELERPAVRQVRREAPQHYRLVGC